MAGLIHPISGLDHMLAMLAVGLWAAQLGGRMLWALPLCFVGVMALGGAAGLAGIPFPMVEAGIAASVLVLGLAIAFSAKLPSVASLGLVGVFALFHGHAHGAELAAGFSGLGYTLGFCAMTALLHGVGITGGLLVKELFQKESTSVLAFRLGGAAVSIAGLGIFTGLI